MYKGLDTQDYINTFEDPVKPRGLIFTDKSLINIDNKDPFNKTGIDIVIRDLNNHIYTEYGERVHQPDFGTRIPSLAFEPGDFELEEIIREDLNMVFDYDPRVELISLEIYNIAEQHVMVVIVKLLFIELADTSEFRLEFR